MSDRSVTQGTIAVVGLGKIGLPLSIHYVQHGRRVIGCDVNPQVVALLNAGECHVHEEPGLGEQVAAAVARGTFRATQDTSGAVREASVVVVIVPVVVDANHDVDYRWLDAATESVGKGLQPGTLVVYETTLPAGTTATRLRAILERTSGLTAGQDFFLAYSPERVSSGVIDRDLRTYPKVVGGIDPASTEAGSAFYSSVLDAPIIVMKSTSDAEFVKLIETTYRDVNIALANEFAQYADARGYDVMAAIRAANTQPYSHVHSPGVGVGGHCIPVYPYFMIADADPSELSLPRRSRVVNDDMAEYAADRVQEVIGDLAGQTVLLLGVAYRGDVKETAFTSALLLRQSFTGRGARVLTDDPLFTAEELESRGYTVFTPEDAASIHAIVLQAGHQSYQDLALRQFTNCRVLLDGRRALDPEMVTAAGMRYISIGDGQGA